MNYHITTFGCQMNTADAERIEAVLCGMGGVATPQLDEADVYIVVTCSVRQSAENRARSVLERVAEQKKLRPGCVCILTGCMATKKGFHEDSKNVRRRIQASLPMIDIILDIQALPSLPHILQPYLSDCTMPAALFDAESYLDIRPQHHVSHTAYVPISTGCNNFCTYCIVPYTRGREVSRPIRAILDECQHHIDLGVRDILLLGQNVDSYGKDIDVRFSELLSSVHELRGDFWVHFLSSNPQDMSKDVLHSIRDCSKLQPFIHLPLQSGSDEILRRMGRKYLRNEYDALYSTIRQVIPSVAVTTDMIIGFPGESEKDFLQSAEAFETLQFDMAYLNRYSPRPPAPSSRMRDDVSAGEKKRREHILNDILKKSAMARNTQFVGQTLRCLVKERSTKNENMYIGTTPQLKTVHILSSTPLTPATFADIVISNATSWHLIGRNT